MRLCIGICLVMLAGYSASTSRRELTKLQVRPLVALNLWAPYCKPESNRRFALYSNRQVIFRRFLPDGSPELVSVVLRPDEFTQVLESLTADNSFFALEKFYDVAPYSHPPQCSLFVDQRGIKHGVTVWGSLDPSERLLPPADPSAVHSFRDDQIQLIEADRGRTPAVFVRLLDKILAFDHPRAQPWLPKHVEVSLYRPSQPKDTTPVWPADWTPRDAAKIIIHSPGSRQMLVDYRHLSKIRALADGPVRLEGQDWLLSYRLPLPQEDVWFEYY